jgi:hypothetical protein
MANQNHLAMTAEAIRGYDTFQPYLGKRNQTAFPLNQLSTPAS